MDTFEAIRSRRSVKKFDPAHRMTEDEIRQLMELTILSPTSFNIQNWRFVAVTDQAVKQAVQAAGWNQAQFGDCSLLVFVCGDRGAYGKDTARYWANAGEAAASAIVPMIIGAYEGKPERQRDENLRSGGMAAQTLMLAARAMGYDTCPMVGFDFAKVAEIINLPADHDIIMAITVGKPLEPARARGGQLPLDEVMVRDRFPGA
jgi:nitroreductase